MKSTIILALGILLVGSNAFSADVNYGNTADLSTTTKNFKLANAQYALVPTKVEVQKIPGCNANGETSQDCTKVVVLESEAVVQANVSYVDTTFSSGEANEVSWLTFYFRLSNFSASEVEALKAVYPSWKHPFSRVPAKFAAKNFELSVTKESRTIQVVDVRNSKLCPVQEDGSIQRGCKEVIVYKNVETPVNAVTVSSK